MFREGKVKTYNAERGFGFIQIEGERKDLFFHIKDFPNKNVPPEIGETLKFRVVDDNGKLKADNIVRLDIQYKREPSTVIGQRENFIEQNSPRYSKERSGISKIVTMIGLIAIVILSFVVYQKYQTYKVQKEEKILELMYQQQVQVEDQGAAAHKAIQDLESGNVRDLKNQPIAPVKHAEKPTTLASLYQCDGRQYCSEMTSRAEAVWFTKNCPGTKMDGNHDGEPCESDTRW